MPEIRQNIITRQWVIIATERARRPDEFKAEGGRQVQPAHLPTCPFCPGNEEKTPPETFRLPAEGDWQVRVFPNKFAALSQEGKLVRVNEGIRRTISGVGIHEVIVETPDHSTTLALLGEHEVERVVETYLRRYDAVLKDERVEQVTLFKNHGRQAGTSLEHPHSQLIGTPIIPTEIRERLETALEFYDDNGRCIFCFTLAEECREGLRVVEENDHFVAFLPFAALSPFHIWIFPKRHCASFGCIEDAEADSLARILRRLLHRLHTGLNDPDYNFVIRTAPKESEQVRYYHWYVSVVPRVSRVAGFELGSGMFINVARPEDSAAFLRGVSVD
jgi:UDPglucose--hexose-1-phosphate uridylyltransferase